MSNKAQKPRKQAGMNLYKEKEKKKKDKINFSLIQKVMYATLKIQQIYIKKFQWSATSPFALIFKN